MVVYSIDVAIDKNIEDEWIDWMKKTHIPNVLFTGYFLQSNVFRSFDEDEDKSFYNIRYKISSFEKLNEYKEKKSKVLQEEFKEFMARYPGQTEIKRTVWQEV